jgi:hypothetical protein
MIRLRLPLAIPPSRGREGAAEGGAGEFLE